MGFLTKAAKQAARAARHQSRPEMVRPPASIVQNLGNEVSDQMQDLKSHPITTVKSAVGQLTAFVGTCCGGGVLAHNHLEERKTQGKLDGAIGRTVQKNKDQVIQEVDMYYAQLVSQGVADKPGLVEKYALQCMEEKKKSFSRQVRVELDTNATETHYTLSRNLVRSEVPASEAVIVYKFDSDLARFEAAVQTRADIELEKMKTIILDHAARLHESSSVEAAEQASQNRAMEVARRKSEPTPPGSVAEPFEHPRRVSAPVGIQPAAPLGSRQAGANSPLESLSPVESLSPETLYVWVYAIYASITPYGIVIFAWGVFIAIMKTFLITCALTCIAHELFPSQIHENWKKSKFLYRGIRALMCLGAFFMG